MKTEQQTEEKTKSSSNPLVIGAGSGIVFGSFFGPVGALVGSVAGASIAFWYDRQDLSLYDRSGKVKANFRGMVKKRKKRTINRFNR